MESSQNKQVESTPMSDDNSLHGMSNTSQDTTERREYPISHTSGIMNEFRISQQETQKGIRDQPNNVAPPHMASPTVGLPEESGPSILRGANKRSIHELVAEFSGSLNQAKKARHTLADSNHHTLHNFQSMTLQNAEAKFHTELPTFEEADVVMAAHKSTIPKLTISNNTNLMSQSADFISKSIDPASQAGSCGEDQLQCTLLKHQKIALQWMKRAELDSNKKGGILADEMGLGKTVTAISLMLSHKVEPSAPDVKTNLIVVPNSVLKQWVEEIENKIKPEHKLTVFEHHTKKEPWEVLRNYDVVVTTYHTIMSDFRKLDKYTTETAERGEVIDNDYLSQLCPLLGPNSIFLRIILDEAQSIKNRKAKCSLAAYRLKATYRWCMTGTPMQNGPLELGSLIHFLRIEPWCDLDRFKTFFSCLGPKEIPTEEERRRAEKQLSAIFKDIALQRGMDTMIDGEPIIKMPKKTELIHYVVLSDEQQKFYTDLKRNSRVEISSYLRDGVVGKKYHRLVVLLLRLRQACCHPDLQIAEIESEDGLDDEMVKAANALAPDKIKRIMTAKTLKCSVCNAVVGEPSIMSPCGHHLCQECMDAFVDSEQQRGMLVNADDTTISCLACKSSNYKGTTGSKVINYHIFQAVHASCGNSDEQDGDDDDSMDSSLDEEDDGVDKRGNLKNFVVDDDDDEEEDPKEKNKGKGKDKEVQPKTKLNKSKKVLVLRQKANSNQQTHRQYMDYLQKIWKPSAKVTECGNIVEKVLKTTQEKIIIFSQWTFFLDLIEAHLTNRLHVNICRYDGSLSTTKRNNNLHKFTKDPAVKVILMSLNAGNAGINLTAASQVILMEPFWNPYKEEQAIGRAYRIGQSRDVTIHRILVKDTVEDAIIDRQNKKRLTVESIKGEKERKAAIERVANLDTNSVLQILREGTK